MSESNNKLQNLTNEQVDKSSSQRPSKLKTAVNNAIAKLWIALSLTWWNGAFNVISWWTTVAIVAACEPQDQKWPEIDISEEILRSGIPIKKPEILSNNGTTIRLWSNHVATCSDKESWIADVTVSVNGKTIKKWDNLTIDKSCSATINATDINGNHSSKTFEINFIDTTPECIFYKPEIPAFQWDKITRNNGELSAWTEKAFEFNNNEYNLTLIFDKKDENGNIKHEDITNQLPFELKEIWDQNLEITLSHKESWKPKSRTTTLKVSETNQEKPEITYHESSAEVSEWDTITETNKEVFAWDTKILAWNSDDYIASYEFDNQTIQSLPFTIKNGGVLKCTLENTKNWQTRSRSTTIKLKDEAPEIKREKTEANIFWWVKLTMENNQFSLWDVLYATWTDDNTQNLTMSFEVDWQSYKSWDIISVASDWKTHTWKLTYTDEKDKSKSGEINLKNNITEAISWRENINSLNLKVGQETNLLSNVKFNDAELKKLEIQVNNWQWQEISEPYRYTPTNTWTIVVRLTIQWPMWNTAPWTSNTLTIEKAPSIEYHAMPIENLDPYRILSNLGIGPIERWDDKVYEYIKDLWIAEGMWIRKMMWLHGAGGHTAKEYNEYLSRTNLVMVQETPDNDKYNNFDRIWEPVEVSWSTNHHANNELGILTHFAGEHTNLMVSGRNPDKKRYWALYEFAKNNPNSMIIVCCSAQPSVYTQDSYKDQIFNEKIIDLFNLKNVIGIFSSGNTRVLEWIHREILYNGICEWNSNWYRNYSSMANSSQNNHPDCHMTVSVWTNSTWHTDITNAEGSLLPKEFDEDVLLAGFAFPYYNWYYNCFYGDPLTNWWWDSSYWTYINGGTMGLEFDLHADTEDADQLLSMTRSSSIENSITLNWDTQKLQRLNVAEYIRQYNMTLDVPKKIKPWETIMLTKWYYKWTIYEWPWVEVYIKWKWWVANTKENESIIKAQDPFELDTRRINGGWLSQYWILPWNTFQITERTVDDQWNWTTISKDFNITVEQ